MGLAPEHTWGAGVQGLASGEGGMSASAGHGAWRWGLGDGPVLGQEPREECSGAGTPRAHIPAVTSRPSDWQVGAAAFFAPVSCGWRGALRSHIWEPPDSQVWVPMAPRWPLSWPDRPVPESSWGGWPGPGR